MVGLVEVLAQKSDNARVKLKSRTLFPGGAEIKPMENFPYFWIEQNLRCFSFWSMSQDVSLVICCEKALSGCRKHSGTWRRSRFPLQPGGNWWWTMPPQMNSRGRAKPVDSHQRAAALGVFSGVPCLFCHHKTPLGHWMSGCPNEIRCMRELDVQSVFQAIESMLLKTQ